MPASFKVKALFEYKSDEPDDLTFQDGQIITVTEEEDADWYTGEYVNGAGQKLEGLFPRNFVEKYEPVIPSRPARAPRRPAQPEANEPSAAAESLPSPPLAQQAFKEPEPVAEPSKESNISREPVAEPETIPAPKPAPAETKPAKQPPPPVAEKPTSSSFKDRIAAFNKPAAAPVTPFKPQSGAGGGSGFIKKPFVAPPPSRNAFVPPTREAPPQKAYRREEDPDFSREDEEERQPPPPPPVRADTNTQEEGDDQPQPTSLKERIALLQKQQMEQAARQADAAKKKEKPKRPSKPKAEAQDVEESTEAPLARADTNDTVGKQSAEMSRVEEDEVRDHRTSIEKTGVTMTPPLPSRELVSDTNDADDSGAADTEDAQETSTEEERPKPKIVKAPTQESIGRAEPRQVPAAAPAVDDNDDEEDEEDEENEEEEEEDPEVRRRRELRERMAKMSGGMGMMGMLGGGMPAAARKPKAAREEQQLSQSPEEETARAPPVPIMALPGMSNKQKPKDVESESDHDDTAQPTPLDPRHPEEPADYISHQPVRRSTDASLHDRAPPPPPPSSRPEPPSSPGARPIPPPPPPSKAEDLPMTHPEDDDYERPLPPPPSTRPVPTAPAGAPRGAPPPPPSQPQSAIAEPPSGAPPIPMSPTSPQNRGPPPPPPAQPPSRRSTVESASKSRVRDDSDEEVTEYDGDYDTDIASSAKHKDALKSHTRDSSFEEEPLTDDATKSPQSPPARAVPPVPQGAPRDVPPPPPTQAPLPKSRKSVDAPRAPPPPIPATSSPTEEDEYDPYRYSAPQHGLPSMVSALRSPTEEFETDEMYEATPQATRTAPPPLERSMPPAPPSDRSAPPLPHESMSMSGALAAPEQRNRQSLEIGRSSTTSRRSAEAPRASVDQGIIARDIDLGQSSMWWTQENTAPPSVQGRPDILYEVESSTSQKRGGKTSVTRDVYVLYQDYSQTTINAKFDPAEPQHVSFEQSHEKPPIPPRKDQLENAWEAFGSEIARTAEKTVGSTVGEGTANEFVLSLLRPLHSALMPVGTRAYGALVYSNMANASTQQLDEIRAGDIITFRNAKFGGHKGSLHQKYSMDVGKPEHVAVVIDWDGTKKKIRAWEQGREEKGKKSKVREESYRVSDLKSGEVRVWRVMPRQYVNWGSS